MKDQSAKRLLTDHYLQVLDKDTGAPIENVYALGDCETIKDYDLPATAQVANQKAVYLRKRKDNLFLGGKKGKKMIVKELKILWKSGLFFSD